MLGYIAAFIVGFGLGIMFVLVVLDYALKYDEKRVAPHKGEVELSAHEQREVDV